jgi:hypothetical protein
MLAEICGTNFSDRGSGGHDRNGMQRVRKNSWRINQRERKLVNYNTYEKKSE